LSQQRRLLSALLCLVSALLYGVPALGQAAAPPSTVWLERMAQSMNELTYRGVLSYARDGHLESLRITHAVVEGEPMERLEHLDGERRELIRRGKQLTCIQLDQRFNLFLSRPRTGEGLSGINDHYNVLPGKQERIAGRYAIAVAIMPRDALRYGYRLSLDRDTALLLRSEVVDITGKVLERVQFVDIEIGLPPKKEWFALPESAKPAGAVHAVNADEVLPIERVLEVAQMPWRPQWLPPGFTLAVAPHKPSEDVLTYSDGLAVLSIFIETTQDKAPASPGQASQGATVAY